MEGNFGMFAYLHSVVVQTVFDNGVVPKIEVERIVVQWVGILLVGIR